MPAVILNLPTNDISAIQDWGQKRGYPTTAAVIEAWIVTSRQQALAEWQSDRWAQRTRVLETNPGLASQVDALIP